MVVESKDSLDLMEFSNEYLLKFDTHNKYATSSQLKRNICKYVTAHMPEYISALDKINRIGKDPKSPIAYFSFSDQTQLETARKYLSQIIFRRQSWKEIVITSSDLAITHRKSKRAKKNREESSVSNVCPLSHIDYPLQLDTKKKHCNEIAKKIQRKSYANHYNKNILPIDVMPSPIINGYRNNVTLTFGKDSLGVNCIGFNSGRLIDGCIALEPLPQLTVHTLVKVYVDAINNVWTVFSGKEEYVEALRFYNKVDGSGVWRHIQVRHNVQYEVMVDLQLKIPDCTENKNNSILHLINNILIHIKDALIVIKEYPLVSLQYHWYSGKSSADSFIERHVLYGTGTFIEYLNKCKFQISPSSFFQVNTQAMSLLLNYIANKLPVELENTILLDLCCGTGILGLSLAHRVHHVYGIDIVQSAIDNAKINAVFNQVKNTTYICQSVEIVLHSLLKKINETTKDIKPRIIALLDPPRAGVHHKVIQLIRQCEQIKDVIYVSCNQSSLVDNSDGLLKLSTNKYSGIPFVLKDAIGIDFFPHTKHVEMVTYFTRDEP